MSGKDYWLTDGTTCLAKEQISFSELNKHVFRPHSIIKLLLKTIDLDVGICQPL
jgi:hypothetical protein